MGTVLPFPKQPKRAPESDIFAALEHAETKAIEAATAAVMFRAAAQELRCMIEERPELATRAEVSGYIDPRLDTIKALETAIAAMLYELHA